MNQKIKNTADRNIAGFLGIGGWVAVAIFATLVALS